MLVYGKSPILGDFNLTLLDFGIIKFFDPAALQTYQMVMVSAARKFKHRFATFKMVALKQSSLLELGKYPVDSGKTDILALADQCSVNIFRRKVPYGAALEQAQYSKARSVAFKPMVLRSFGLLIAMSIR